MKCLIISLGLVKFQSETLRHLEKVQYSPKFVLGSVNKVLISNMQYITFFDHIVKTSLHETSWKEITMLSVICEGVKVLKSIVADEGRVSEPFVPRNWSQSDGIDHSPRISRQQNDLGICRPHIGLKQFCQP